MMTNPAQKEEWDAMSEQEKENAIADLRTGIADSNPIPSITYEELMSDSWTYNGDRFMKSTETWVFYSYYKSDGFVVYNDQPLM